MQENPAFTLDDELREYLGVSLDALDAYDPAAAVTRTARPGVWSYTTLQGNEHPSSFDTKREATRAAVRHKQLKLEQYENPSAFCDIVGVRARRRLALLKEYMAQGMPEMDAGRRAMAEVPEVPMTKEKRK
jgi:hypothetical protein